MRISQRIAVDAIHPCAEMRIAWIVSRETIRLPPYDEI
jgi:hypothetical protein